MILEPVRHRKDAAGQYWDVTELYGAMFWGGCRLGEGTSWSLGYKWILLAEVSDGLSNTLVLSETVQGERVPSVSALCAGASLEEAAFVGNLTASVTIQKLGQTGTASPDEILRAFDAI